MSDYDPRLVELYDVDNPDGPDHDFYRALAEGRGARSVLDLGCGTGILTVTLATGGREVVGVDPSASMLAYARARPGAERVRWIEGDASAAPAAGFDLALMTGNVAQHVPEAQWKGTLRHLRRIVRSGGTLAFESRNPAARAWEGWTSQERRTRPTPHGPLAEWSRAELLDDGITVELVSHNLFLDADETVVQTQHLVFRSRERIEAELHDAGFELEAVSGDWAGTPFGGDEPIMVFVARAR